MNSWDERWLDAPWFPVDDAGRPGSGYQNIGRVRELFQLLPHAFSDAHPRSPQQLTHLSIVQKPFDIRKEHTQ